MSGGIARRIYSYPGKYIIDINGTALCCPVYKVLWFSKVRRLEMRVLAVIPNSNQLFGEQ